MTTGTEWFIDATGCRRTALSDLRIVRAVCEAVVAEMQLCVVGEPAWHQFPHPGGVTGLYLLTESHLTCHTFPEWGVATFNLYCCRPRDEWPWEQRLTELLEAQRVVVRKVPRGGLAPSPESAREIAAHLGRPTP